jgi:hypothetical protein
MADEWLIGRDFERSGRAPIVVNLFGGTEENYDSQDSQFVWRGLKRGLLITKQGVQPLDHEVR